MSRHLRTTLALALATTSLTAVAVAGAPASFAACAVESIHYSTPYEGRKVWIPTSTFSDWKKGGRITRRETDGESTASTVGSVHDVTVEGKAGGKIGPVGVEVTTRYNYVHSKSTTNRTSVTRGWDYTFNVPTDALYRARAYKRGWIFKYKRTITYTNACVSKKQWFFAATPVKANRGVYYWALEKYSNKGKYRYDGL